MTSETEATLVDGEEVKWVRYAGCVLDWFSPMLLVFIVLSVLIEGVEAAFLAAAGVVAWKFFGRTVLAVGVLGVGFVAVSFLDVDEILLRGIQVGYVVLAALAVVEVRARVVEERKRKGSRPWVPEGPPVSRGGRLVFLCLWWGMGISLAVFSRPILTLRAFPFALLLVPVVGMWFYVLQVILAPVRLLERRLLFLACVGVCLVFRVFTGFAYGDPLVARGGMAFVVAIAFLPGLAGVVRTDARRLVVAGVVVLLGVSAFLAMPRRVHSGRVRDFAFAVMDPIWRPRENGYSALLHGFFLDKVRTPPGETIWSMRQSPYEWDLYDAYLVWESDEWGPECVPDDWMVVDGELDGRPLFYEPNAQRYGVLGHDGMVDAITSGVACAYFAGWERNHVSPDERYLLQYVTGVTSGTSDFPEDYCPSVYDRRSQAFARYPDYTGWRVVSWLDDETLLLLRAPLSWCRAKNTSSSWRSVALNVRTGESEALREGVLPCPLGYMPAVGRGWVVCLAFDPPEDTVGSRVGGEPREKGAIRDAPKPFVLNVVDGRRVPIPPAASEGVPWWDTRGEAYCYVSLLSNRPHLTVIGPSGHVTHCAYPFDPNASMVCLSPDSRHAAVLVSGDAKCFGVVPPRVAILDLGTGKAQLVDCVAGGLMPVDGGRWGASWSPDGKRLGYSVSCFRPLRLRWWLVYRELADIVSFVRDMVEMQVDGPRSCGTGIVTGPTFSNGSRYRIVDVVAGRERDGDRGEK